MNIRYGNLVKEAQHGFFDAIMHGCNCHNTMGGGIAREIKKVFPEAYEADTKAYKARMARLGEISVANYVLDDRSIDIINCYTQYNYGTEKRQLDYEALAKCFEKINNQYAEMTVGMPMIGCGLAGGNWDIVKTMASEILTDVNLVVVLFPDKNAEYLNAVNNGIIKPDFNHPLYELGNVTYDFTKLLKHTQVNDERIKSHLAF